MINREDFDLLQSSAYLALGSSVLEVVNVSVQAHNAATQLQIYQAQQIKDASSCDYAIRAYVQPWVDSAIFLQGSAGTPKQRIDSALTAANKTNDVFGIRFGLAKITCTPDLVGENVRTNVLTAANSIKVDDVHLRDLQNLSQALHDADATVVSIANQPVKTDLVAFPNNIDAVSGMYFFVMGMLLAINLTHSLSRRFR